ncbi:hypothetical protein SETIT_8G054000v2 [Setaria italica]|uniref:Uncharacterized protein n=1 Tax=Setaria italica TaxID=4555 RepID=A0A368S4G0_SETIT|nr:hypothetical protein SETIT_8G054000v2 [Setaria italica]
MRTEVINTDSIFEAAKRILRELKEEAAGIATSSSRPNNAIYFDAWDGLGAAAAEEDPAPPGSRRAPAAAGPEFSHVFHIDCSKWESRRAMQRTIAEKLELPAPVMDMLDAQDEEDDYHGVDGLPCSEEIHLDSFGFPLSGYSRNKVLWSFQGRFRLYPRKKVDRALKSTRTTTDVVISANTQDPHCLSGLLSSEAEEVAHGRNATDSFCDWWADASHHRQARYCFEYMMKLCHMGMVRGLPGTPYWTSPTYGSMIIPHQHGVVPKGMFQQFDKLRVLKLSACWFSFTSPPFLCCHSLRFLWLDHCYDQEWRTEDGEAKDEDIHRCFKRLWVLDAGEEGERAESRWREREGLHNIRKLRVIKSSAIDYRDRRVMFSRNDKMELLDFSGYDGNIESLSVESNCSSLETVIIDGSDALKGISLKGCAKLKSLQLSGLFLQLYSLDLSGTAVKTLDFSAMTAPNLDELFLLDCEKLCAILWQPRSEGRRKRYLSKLRIDTTQKEVTAAADSGSRSPAEFDWHICVRDAS